MPLIRNKIYTLHCHPARKVSPIVFDTPLNVHAAQTCLGVFGVWVSCGQHRETKSPQKKQCRKGQIGIVCQNLQSTARRRARGGVIL